jgi:hypothetical protein
VRLEGGKDENLISRVLPALVRRDDTVRTMDHEDVAVRQALVMLGQPVNPVRVVTSDRIRELYWRTGMGDPPPGLHAFRAPGDMSDPHIYVNADSTVYREAVSKPSAVNMLKLAASLVHEQVHNTDREFAAYRLQSDFVRSRLKSLPPHQGEAAARFMEIVEAAARALARVEQRGLRASGLRLTR